MKRHFGTKASAFSAIDMCKLETGKICAMTFDEFGADNIKNKKDPSKKLSLKKYNKKLRKHVDYTQKK